MKKETSMDMSDLGRTPAGQASIDDRDVGPVPAQMVGADQSDGAAADDDHVLRGHWPSRA